MVTIYTQCVFYLATIKPQFRPNLTSIYMNSDSNYHNHHHEGHDYTIIF